MNPNTPADVLTALAKDENLEVRINVAGNPNTPEAVLTMLDEDPNGYVCACLAKNPNSPANKRRLAKELAAARQILEANGLTVSAAA